MNAVVDRPRPRLRAMTEDDLDGVMRIEEACYDFPWGPGIFNDCMRVGYCCRVAELDGEIVGYAILSFGAGEAHLLNICVAMDWQGRGVAGALLDGVMADALRRKAGTLFLEVRPSNLAARRLYRSRGFREIGVRRHYYPADEGREDALVLSRGLGGAPGPKAASVSTRV
mgnify:CR=1 FL=1